MPQIKVEKKLQTKDGYCYIIFQRLTTTELEQVGF